MAIPRIPTIDFSSIFKECDEDGKKKVIDEVGKACLEFGFFQVINHGLPLNLINHARVLCKTFFEYPVDEKLKYKSRSTIIPASYGRMDSFVGCNESLKVAQPEMGVNVLPDNPPELRETLEELYQQIRKLALIVESIINEYLRLPVDFLKNYNDDRSNDALIAWHYPASSAAANNKMIGRQEHQDTDLITFLLQDEVGGLEVEIDGKWIPIIPMEGALVVNIGVLVQVLTNKRMVAAKHRVLRNGEKSRQSLVYFYNIGGDKWIEPLPQFTHEIGEAPKYRGFFYKEFFQARLNKESNPPANSQDLTEIDHYEIKSIAIPVDG